MFRRCLVSLIVLTVPVAVAAQQNPASVATPPTNNQAAVPVAPPTDDRYRIGPGDILEVRVARVPEFSRDAVRVDQRGMIRMPMLDVDIPAACLTESEVSQNIAKLYLKYKKNPHVDVFVKEYQSQIATVNGAVRSPSQFKLQRPIRLAELMSYAGGPTESAGDTVDLIRGALSLCELRAGLDADDINTGIVTYKLSDILHAAPDANPFVRGGDLIQVPPADVAYVVGNVLRPMGIPIKEPLTVSRAIAIAGGTAPATKKDKIRIIRQVPGGTTKQEIVVDLGAIAKNQAPDVFLLKGDIVHVPKSGPKSMLLGLMGAIGPAAGQLPIMMIP